MHRLLSAVASLVVEHRPYSTDSVIVAHRLSCSATCGIFPDQRSNPWLLHGQVDSLPLSHQEACELFLYNCVWRNCESPDLELYLFWMISCLPMSRDSSSSPTILYPFLGLEFLVSHRWSVPFNPNPHVVQIQDFELLREIFWNVSTQRHRDKNYSLSYPWALGVLICFASSSP